jgi:hypothetical protein
MRLPLLLLIGLMMSVKAQAFTLEPSASLTLLNQYKIDNLNATYDLQGALFRIDGLFNFGEDLITSDHFFWGVGFNYGVLNGDLHDSSLASPTLPNSVRFNTYIPQAILGWAISNCTIKLLVSPFTYLKEQEGVNEGDEKYGYGGGLELGYKIFENVALNAGYQYYSFSKGKNKSTGLSGSLANPVKMNFFTFGVSFPFSFESQPTSFRGRGRSGRR